MVDEEKNEFARYIPDVHSVDEEEKKTFNAQDVLKNQNTGCIQRVCILQCQNR